MNFDLLRNVNFDLLKFLHFPHRHTFFFSIPIKNLSSPLHIPCLTSDYLIYLQPFKKFNKLSDLKISFQVKVSSDSVLTSLGSSLTSKSMRIASFNDWVKLSSLLVGSWFDPIETSQTKRDLTIATKSKWRVSICR